MKMNVTDTVKQACGHWPRILPALGAYYREGDR